MTKRTNTLARRRTSSGAAGGPATGSGINFQVDFAIRQTLVAISQTLADPLADLQISLEPRLVATDRSATSWDVRLSHPECVTEVKLNPKRVDILTWMDRVEAAARKRVDCTFEFCYGRGGNSLLTAMDSLSRIAKEADGDLATFQDLVAIEQRPATNVILNHLRTEPHISLLRAHVTSIHPRSLQEEIQFLLRLLVREPGRKPLYNLLSAEFHKGIEHRTTYHVRDLVRAGEQVPVTFNAFPTFVPQHLTPVVSSAIYILQHCRTGLPSEVLAAGVGCTTREVDEFLSKHRGAAGLTYTDGSWAIGPVRPPLANDNGLRVVAKALRQLLEFIGHHKKNSLGWEQVPNAIELAKVCQSEDHELVSGLFWKLDKLLKRTGSKQLVLEVAEMSLDAARRAPRTEAKTKGEAVALICGRAWVFQRIDRLAEARADGERSLELGEDIGWYRNSAFCLKCLGRLFRMEAERHRRDKDRFGELLRCSIDYLSRAIDSFPNATELTPADRIAEVGDCYSLLGRSHLVGGALKKADAAVREAIERITDETSKDYADLQILLGDLAFAQGDLDAAVSFYDEAIRAAGTSGAERSEIAARAHLQKGHATKSTRSYDRAAEVWERLEEDELADGARWHSMLHGGRVPVVAKRVLEEEAITASVCVETIRMYEADLARLGNARGRRAEPAEGYWRELLPEARKSAAVRHVEW